MRKRRNPGPVPGAAAPRACARQRCRGLCLEAALLRCCSSICRGLRCCAT
jgi:hypothetical protein